MIALSGMVNLTQPLIDAMDHDVFHDNPIPVNVFLATLGFVFGTSLVVYVYMQGHKVAKVQVEQMAEFEELKNLIACLVYVLGFWLRLPVFCVAFGAHKLDKGRHCCLGLVCGKVACKNGMEAWVSVVM